MEVSWCICCLSNLNQIFRILKTSSEFMMTVLHKQEKFFSQRRKYELTLMKDKSKETKKKKEDI